MPDDNSLASTPSPETSHAEHGVQPRRYRLPSATRLGRVRLQVADLSRSLLFYEMVLGLRVLARDAGVVVLGTHDESRALVELHERAGAHPMPRRGRLGLYHFALLLPDRPALGRFLQHVFETGGHTGMSDHLYSEAVYLSDPDGLGIEVYADRPRETWQYRNREFIATVEPLDVDGLVRAGGGEQWRGMPPGAVLGHVHLHVGDLEASGRFFHDGLGFDKTTWTFPRALFLGAGGYHHHLGTNTWAAHAERPTVDDARLLEWEVVLPTPADVQAAATSVRDGGFALVDDARGFIADDPWGTRVRVVAG